MNIFKPLDSNYLEKYVSVINQNRKDREKSNISIETDELILGMLIGESLPNDRFCTCFLRDTWQVTDLILLLVGLARQNNRDKKSSNSPGEDISKHTIKNYEARLRSENITEGGTVERIDGFSVGLCKVYIGLDLIGRDWWDYKHNMTPLGKQLILDTCKDFQKRLSTASLISELWGPDQHPESPTVSYMVSWAMEKGIEIEWLDWAIENAYVDEKVYTLAEDNNTIERSNAQHECVYPHFVFLRDSLSRNPNPKEVWSYLKKNMPVGIGRVDGKPQSLNIEGNDVDYDSFRHWKLFKK